MDYLTILAYNIIILTFYWRVTSNIMGYGFDYNRGKSIIGFLIFCGLGICNNPTLRPSFISSIDSGNLSLRLVSFDLLNTWNFLKNETFSDHLYINYDINNVYGPTLELVYKTNYCRQIYL